MKCNDCKFFLKDESGYSELGWCQIRLPPNYIKDHYQLQPTDSCDLGQPIPDTKETT